MKKTLLTAAVLISAPAFANCIGGAYLQTCNDVNGNSYTVNRMGNTTQVSGYNPNTGSQWNQTSQTIGNSTYTNGRAANGASWNETQTNYGNGMRSINGTDSNGNSFSKTCTAYGCNWDGHQTHNHRYGDRPVVWTRDWYLNTRACIAPSAGELSFFLAYVGWLGARRPRHLVELHRPDDVKWHKVVLPPKTSL
jgi:hypothetical protein